MNLEVLGTYVKNGDTALFVWDLWECQNLKKGDVKHPCFERGILPSIAPPQTRC